MGDAADLEQRSRTEIVTIGRGFVISYDTNGRELWRLKGMTQATPSPVAAGGLLYVGSGSQGEANRPLLAIRPNAPGDISLKDGQTGQRVRRLVQPRFSGYTPSPLVYRGRIYAINDNGVLQVADAKPAPMSSRPASVAADHLLELAAREPGPHLSPQRGWRDVRLRRRRSLRRGRKEQHGRDEPGNTSRRWRQPVPRTQTKLYRIRNAEALIHPGPALIIRF